MARLKFLALFLLWAAAAYVAFHFILFVMAEAGGLLLVTVYTSMSGEAWELTALLFALISGLVIAWALTAK